MEKDAISKPGKAAKERFAQSFNCAQSVFATFAVQHDMNEATALKLASLLGGGVSRRGEICGAVSGALLALGLVRGSDTPEGKEEAYRLGQEFMNKFEAKHKNILCRDLLGYDVSQPESRQKARDAGVFESVCPLLVRDAAEIVQAMLEAESS